MCSDIAIKVENLSKCYQIYDKPADRLKQSLYPRVQRLFGREPRQYFKEFWALKDVSFEVNKGETVGIIGRNGSGKSTLLQMICGTLTPTAGSVQIFGRVAALLELGAGFNPEFTGRENTLLNAAILGISQNNLEFLIKQVIEFSELGNFFNQPVKTYSSGMYARLAFSIAINVDPEILVVDEALAVGDARFVAKCMKRIKDIQERGALILFVSHDVGAIRTLCERVIWLDKGTLIEQGHVFPVTGRFMEFMFKDDEKESTTIRKEITASKQDLSSINRALLKDENLTTLSNTSELLPILPTQAEESLHARPVTHWGSHKGIILSATLCDEQETQKDIFIWGEKLKVIIKVCIPKNIPREHLSIAFSIKDLKGTDLIVSTTYDIEPLYLPDKESFGVCFNFANFLVTGKYLLVAAVENRQYHSIHYYEYVEGTHYFATLANERFFGLFQPSIEQEVLV